jgi:integrase
MSIVGKKIRVSEGIYKRVDKKGEMSYYINYRDEFGKNKWSCVGKKKDGITVAYCKQKRSQIINMKNLGEDVSSIRKKVILSFDDITQDYFEHVKYANYKNQNSFKQRYNDHIKESLGHLPIDKITKKHINDLVILLKKKNLSASSIERIRQQISATFTTAINNEKCKNNPASISKGDGHSMVRLNKKSINNNRERYLSKEEAKLLLETLKDYRFDLYFMALISLTTGARVGEILGLQNKNIDIINGFFNLEETKNGTSRKLKMTKTVSELIKNRDIDFSKPNDYLFKSKYGTKLTGIPHIYTKIVKELFNSELDNNDRRNKVCFHTLRHTFASQLAIQGTPIFTIQKLMGHKSIDMTLRYAKLSPDVGVEAVEALENKFIL